MGAKTKVIVSSRGQVTLPSAVRKHLGLEEGSVVTLEERAGEIVLRPTTVLEVEFYTEKQIQGWLKKDKLSNVERKRIQKKIGVIKNK